MREDEEQLIQINNIFEYSSKTYGSPRIKEELQGESFRVSNPRVVRIMKAPGARAIKPRRSVVTTDLKLNYPITPNIQNKEFTAIRPRQVWVSDITNIKTNKGWLYLTVIIDLFYCKNCMVYEQRYDHKGNNHCCMDNGRKKPPNQPGNDFSLR